MLGLYYRIWTDCIKRIKSRPDNNNDWQVTSIFSMTLAMTFNFILIITVIEKFFFGHVIYDINLPFLHGPLKSLFNFIVLFFVPCLILNYLLIFRNKRYERFFEKYPYHDGKLFATYFSISLFLPIALMCIGVFFFS